MSDPTELSRRERQIMDLVFALGEATVNQVAERLPDPPTPMAVRRMMHILEEKNFLVRRQEGREVVYRPAQSKVKAGESALQHVLDTFFGGALDEALAAHFSRKKTIRSR
jgi:predicted transcriptional regulator